MCMCAFLVDHPAQISTTATPTPPATTVPAPVVVLEVTLAVLYRRELSEPQSSAFQTLAFDVVSLVRCTFLSGKISLFIGDRGHAMKVWMQHISDGKCAALFQTAFQCR